MKQKNNILRWCGLGIFLIVFFNMFFLPYIQFENSLSTLFADMGRNTWLSLLNLIGVSLDYSSAIAVAGTILLLLPPAACVLLGASGSENANNRLPARLASAASVIGFFSLVIHVIFCFWLADLYFNDQSIIPGSASGVKLGYGNYLNLCLLFIGTALSVSLFAMYSRTTVIRPLAGASGAIPEKMPQPESDGVIIGTAGMYRYATFRIKNSEELIIGRDAALSHIIVDTDAEKVSRKHCSLVYDSQHKQYFATDYSSNGTYKEDGAPLPKNKTTPLPCGTIIYLGNRKNSFLLK